MKTLRPVLCLVVLSLSAVAFAQTDATKPKPPKSETELTFDKLKTLAGAWEGRVTTDPPEPSMQGKLAKVWLRVTSRGNAILHEIKPADMPDNPITMLYLDTDRLMLTHYCDAGNRPRMVGKMSPDGKAVEFDFLDIAGSTRYGHMQRAAFIPIDADHHIEEWTFMLQGDKAVRARFDLRRAK